MPSVAIECVLLPSFVSGAMRGAHSQDRTNRANMASQVEFCASTAWFLAHQPLHFFGGIIALPCEIPHVMYPKDIFFCAEQNITKWRSAKQILLNKASVCRTRAKEDNTYSGAALGYARRQVSNMINFRYLVAHVTLLKCRVRPNTGQRYGRQSRLERDHYSLCLYCTLQVRLQESRQDLSG